MLWARERVRVWKREDGSPICFRGATNGGATADDVGRRRRGTIRRSGWIFDDIGSAFRGELVHAKIPWTAPSQPQLSVASGITHWMSYSIETAKKEKFAFGVRERENRQQKVVFVKLCF